MNYQWIVSLNDGQRISSKSLITGDGKNPWNKVLDYVKANKNPDGTRKQINHIELLINRVVYRSPSHKEGSNFQSNLEAKNFWIFYKDSAELNSNQKAEHYVAFSYRCGDFRHIFWAGESFHGCYAQVLNVVNPESEVENIYSTIELHIEKTYQDLDN